MMQHDWFKIVPLGHGLTAIGEPRYAQQNWSYLICGQTRALLFDTGSFYGQIAPVVAALTDLPLTALPSHMHYDHLGNVTAFDRVVLPDLAVLRACAQDDRMTPSDALFLGQDEGRAPPVFDVAAWLAIGAWIDLGGTRLQVVHTPGHSPDSVSLWWPDQTTLLAADFLYPGPLYAQVPGADLSDYLASARALDDMLPHSAQILGAHGDADDFDSAVPPKLPRTVLSDLIACLAGIVANPPATPDGTVELPVSDGMTMIVSATALAALLRDS